MQASPHLSDHRVAFFFCLGGRVAIDLARNSAQKENLFRMPLFPIRLQGIEDDPSHGAHYSMED